MKKTLVISALVAAVLAIAPVMGSKCSCPPPPSWTGFYIGVQGGYGWREHTKTTVYPLPDPLAFFFLAPTYLRSNLEGGLGGAELGYNWQINKFVLGLEADFTFCDLTYSRRETPIIQLDGHPFPGAGFIESKQKTDWFTTFRPRIGYTLSDCLFIYLTGGVAWGHTKYQAVTDFLPPGTETYPISFNKTTIGITGGAGFEYAFSKNWSFKGEYLYVKLNRRIVNSNPIPPLPPFQIRYTFQTQFNTVRLGLNYKFSL